MMFNLALVALGFISSATVIQAALFYAYTCDGCLCTAFQSLGLGIDGTCTNLDNGAAAIGISDTD